jgi:gliding motility-associated-like protein
LGASLNASATHIVGGELSYTCLGGDQYEIELTIFRDCFNGSPNAWFDDPASIGVFSATTNLLLDEILIPLDQMLNDTLQPVLTSECLNPPTNVCVHTTTYTTIENLPFVEGGYILAYQRCCRNETIDNIILPLETGASYTVEISERALQECNSSPKFNTWPPLFICAGFPIFYDQSTTDSDGDSIVYSLCAPYEGADQDIPMPQPPNPPPYDIVNWETGFGVGDMLNGQNGNGQPLTIDSESGFLTGLPLFIGQYVVGICVEEYRDGELIGTTRRDFQYNVEDCGEPGAAFFAPEVQCDDLTVEFENESQNADNYIWIFDVENNPSQTSTDFEPTFNYSDYDEYTVMLIVNPETVCVDTAIQNVTLIPNPLTALFSVEFAGCSDVLNLEITDMSTDEFSFITDWNWEFNVNGTITTSQEQDPDFTVGEDTPLEITLTVTSESGCEETTSQIIQIDVIDEQLSADTLTVCPGEGVNLHGSFTPEYTYLWTPDLYLNNANSPNPFASPEETTTYNVLITNPINGCVAEREITVFVPEQVTVDLGEDFTTCETDIELSAITNTGEQFFWFSDPEFDNLISTEETVNLTPFGETTYYLLVRDELGCPATDEITVIGNGINTEQDDLSLICAGDSVTLNVQNIDSADELTYTWSPAENILSGSQTSSPTVALDGAGTSVFYFEMSNQFGCTKLDSITVAALDTLNQTEFVSSQQCSGYSVQFTNTSINAPYYIWNFGDPSTNTDTSNETNPSYTYPEAGIYNVILSFPPGVDCGESITVPITIVEPSIFVDFTGQVTECGDSITLTLLDQSTNNQSDIISWEWEFSNEETATGQSAEVSVYETQILDAQLIITSEDGCMDTLNQTFDLELIETTLEDTVVICEGESAALYPDADETMTYQWSPADFLDNPNAPNPISTPTETTIYTVTITDISNGYACEVEREVTVFIPTPVDFDIGGETESCGEDLQLYANSINGIQWSDNPDFSTIFAALDTIFIPSERDDIFYARTEDEFGCILIDSIETHNYEPIISLIPNQLICGIDTITLFVNNLVQEDELNFIWSPESEIAGYTDEGNAIVSPSVTTTYNVTVTNQFGCETDASTVVEILDFTPPLEAFAEDDSIYVGQSTQLSSTVYPNFLYTWTPSESLSTGFGSNPIASPEVTTTYQVTIENVNGCNNIANITIHVSKVECRNPFIYIPNTFSPDGDGFNETFGVLGPFIEESYLVVYNRWGDKMFESNEPGAEWDGTLDGSPIAPDVYAYYARVGCLGGEQTEFKGNVTLVR